MTHADAPFRCSELPRCIILLGIQQPSSQAGEAAFGKKGWKYAVVSVAPAARVGVDAADLAADSPIPMP